MPRKPLVIFIEGLFRVAMKITKGFQNVGAVVKLLFKQLESYSALRAFPHFPHHPLVVAVTSGNRLLSHALAVGAFVPAPLRSGNYVRTSLRTPTLHFACIRASTSAPRGISISLLTPYIPFHQSYPCHFPTHFQRLPSFLRRVSPKRTLCNDCKKWIYYTNTMFLLSSMLTEKKYLKNKDFLSENDCRQKKCSQR